jgi:hypothetical protein
MIETQQTLSPRESILMEMEKEEARLAREHDISVRKLELEAVALEQKWTQLYRLPVLIIKLPVYGLLGIAYIVAMARGFEPSDNFWSFIKK